MHGYDSKVYLACPLRMHQKMCRNAVFSQVLGRLLPVFIGFGAIFDCFKRPSEPLNRHFIRLAAYVGCESKAGTPF